MADTPDTKSNEEAPVVADTPKVPKVGDKVALSAKYGLMTNPLTCAQIFVGPGRMTIFDEWHAIQLRAGKLIID